MGDSGLHSNANEAARPVQRNPRHIFHCSGKGIAAPFIVRFQIGAAVTSSLFGSPTRTCEPRNAAPHWWFQRTGSAVAPHPAWGLPPNYRGMITSNTTRAGHASRVLVQIARGSGRQSGLLMASLIMTHNLATVHDNEIDRVLRTLPHDSSFEDRFVPAD